VALLAILAIVFGLYTIFKAAKAKSKKNIQK
jgi:hypothetical protein